MFRTLGTAVASFVFVFIFASISFAQSAPDLSDKNWKFLGENPVIFAVDTGNGQVVGLPATAKLYQNETDKIGASVLMWRGDEVAMAFGTQDDFLMAIKVNGKWYVAKEKGSQIDAVSVVGSDGGQSVKLTLDTTDGLKEVLLNLN